MKNSIERLKKQDYQTPELKVVAFKMEQGFAASAGISISGFEGGTI